MSRKLRGDNLSLFSPVRFRPLGGVFYYNSFSRNPKKRKGTGCLLGILRRVYIQVGVSGGMPNRRLGTLFTVVVVEHSSGSRVFMATVRNQSPGYWHTNSFTSTG